MMPIHQRVVETHKQVLRARRLHVFPHQIAGQTLLRSAEVCEFGVEKAEALLILRVVMTM